MVSFSRSLSCRPELSWLGVVLRNRIEALQAAQNVEVTGTLGMYNGVAASYITCSGIGMILEV